MIYCPVAPYTVLLFYRAGSIGDVTGNYETGKQETKEQEAYKQEAG